MRPPGPGRFRYPAADNYTRQGFVNFTRWSARLPGTQRRAAARTEQTAPPDRRGEGSVPAARAEQLTDGDRPVPAVDDLGVREVLDRVPCLVALVHGPDHRIAYLNDAYTTAFGLRPVGAPARGALPELDELGLLPLLDQVLRSGKPRTVKSRKAPDGRSYTFTCTPAGRATAAGYWSSPPTSPATPRPRSGCAPASAASARPPSPCSAPCSRRSSRSPTTCVSPPPTTRAAPRPRSAATGTT